VRTNFLNRHLTKARAGTFQAEPARQKNRIAPLDLMPQLFYLMTWTAIKKILKTF